MAFLDDDIFLTTRTAKRLYHGIAADQPVVDYHNHLSAREIAEDRRFHNLAELWLESDHYKWRLMRGAGVAETHCTGNAPAREKFLAYAHALSDAPGNPLYHWSHLELKRGFGIDLPLCPKHAGTIWEETSRQLDAHPMTAGYWLNVFRVRVVCTTDDPVDDLHAHQTIARSGSEVSVFPTFRPDALARTADLATWRAYLERLEQLTGSPLTTWDDLCAAVARRHADFHAQGCRSSDHGLDLRETNAPPTSPETLFRRLMDGSTLTPDEQAQWEQAIVTFVAGLNAQRGWVLQLHLGAHRNPRLRTATMPGPDTGFDLIGETPTLRPLIDLFNRLDERDELPKTVLYNIHPRDSLPFAVLAGSFGGPATVQGGPAWWHLDHLDGMTEQLRITAATGALGKFIGMTTDSRGFLSFSRHDMFRRILCEMLGREIELGLYPNDPEAQVRIIAGICGLNARTFFQWPTTR